MPGLLQAVELGVSLTTSLEIIIPQTVKLVLLSFCLGSTTPCFRLFLPLGHDPFSLQSTQQHTVDARVGLLDAILQCAIVSTSCRYLTAADDSDG